MKVVFTFTVKPATPPPNPLTVTPPGGPIPDETVNVDPGVQTLAVISGGTPPYKVSLSSGAFPAGQSLDLTDDGRIELSGTPTQAGDGSFELDVIDSSV